MTADTTSQSDAVVSSVADRLKISKSDILNSESGTTNPAVKLALAETHVIQETKKYLEEVRLSNIPASCVADRPAFQNGIIPEAFQAGSTPRSKTTILVKNIPYGTAAADLEKLFGMHGEVSRLLIPPAGTMAVVEFEHAEEARKAFRGVSYKRMKNSIIYLEWAPEGVFAEDASPSDTKKVTSGVKPVAIEEEIQKATTSTESGGPDGSTLFVKNLNFATTSERLVSAFKALSGFAFARINTKPDPKSADGGKLSMGYGFVGFDSAEHAKVAMKTMQGYVLDGHALLVSFAKRGVAEEKSSDGLPSGKSRSAKIIVRNVPFEASKKDIKELFRYALPLSSRVV